MNIRWLRGGTSLFFLLFLLAVTWPGMTLGNRIVPLVLGLPFSMVWIAGWVVLSFLVLVILDSAEGRARHGDPGGGGGAGQPETEHFSGRSPDGGTQGRHRRDGDALRKGGS